MTVFTLGIVAVLLLHWMKLRRGKLLVKFTLSARIHETRKL